MLPPEAPLPLLGVCWVPTCLAKLLWKALRVLSQFFSQCSKARYAISVRSSLS
jgi:hypothetical protein